MYARSPGTNFYFNNFKQTGEQDLLESLVIESIKVYGIDLWYLPRIEGSYDPIYGEDDTSSYTQAIPIEMYIRSVDGFEGDGQFLSKFGLEIRDQVTFVVARKIFEENIGSLTALPRPMEGDLIFFPLNKKLFQIRFTDHLKVFYPLGALQSYTLTCELFEYGNEVINTGIADIDEIARRFSTNMLDYGVRGEDGSYVVDEHGNIIVNENYVLSDIDPSFDNDHIQDESENWTNEPDTDDIIDWSEYDPFSQNGKY